MTFEWVSPAVVVAGGVAAFARLQQRDKDMTEEMDARNSLTVKAMETIVSQNREDHQLLFQAIAKETDKRTEEDNQIRQNFVSWQKCQDCPARFKSTV